jgi:uncharacterized protein
MDISVEFDLEQVAKGLNLPIQSVRRTVELLDEGNTVPFITRYRKDQTGALDEEQIRCIQQEVNKLRALIERKQAVLKSIQSRGQLTEELATEIRAANTSKRLEDLYLPYKPKKQTLATVARQRGLEPLAREVLDGDAAAVDLQQRAATYVNAENQLATVDDVLAGVGHIIAEWFSERADVRGRLRRIMRQTGRLICRRVETPKRAAGGSDEASAATESDANQDQHPSAPATVDPATASPGEPSEVVASSESGSESPGSPQPAVGEPDQALGEPDPVESSSTEEPAANADGGANQPADRPDVTVTSEAASGSADGPEDPPQTDSHHTGEAAVDSQVGTSTESTPPTPVAEMAPDAESAAAAEPETVASAPPTDDAASAKPAASEEGGAAQPDVATPTIQPSARAKERTSKKEKKRKKLEAAFKDYFSYEEAIAKLPHHRILATNRGERARILKARIEADQGAMQTEAEKLLVPEGHPHVEFLRDCVRDAMSRLLLPSLEREVRRELTEKAELHATEVFARNLRKLLLQPPVNGHRVLAIDPGFRSGCKLIALDQFGKVLDKGIIHVIGREERLRHSRNKLVDLVKKHQLTVIAIGNGTACRETEQLVVEIMGDELKDMDVAFVIVNEAGASVYSTSPLGREELPSYDAVLRSAISIGRRLLDPLSELVKINPANIGVGMYQHDVKAKHLRDSLDAVVESCVNYVGVDANTASPSLLRYVSGLNQLTARRLCEYREQHGPFRTREEFKQVSGFGEATFVQAAGFLKITSGENPLDATWIHPESYDVAGQVLDRLGCSLADLEVGGTAVADASPEKNWPAESLQQIVADVAQRRKQPHDDPTSQPEEASPSVADDSGEQATADSQPQAADEVDAVTSEVDAAVEPPPAANEVAAADAPPLDPVGEETAEPAAVKEVPEPAAEDAADVDRAASQTEPTPTESKSKITELIQQTDVAGMSGDLGVSELLLSDILNSLARPGRDPREDLPPPVFRRGIVKLEDLEPGMQLTGTVLNVVDFGAFVDIGLPDSGLIHISRLADRFVRDPHDVVGVGDIMTVWVMDVDKQRRRVSLTAIEPGTEKPREPRRGAGKQAGRPAGRGRRSEGRKPQHGRRPPHGKDRKRTHTTRAPKVVTPITKEMEEGKAPLRSFSDLMQFYEKQQPGGDKKKS